jgi:hypothetical protein
MRFGKIGTLVLAALAGLGLAGAPTLAAQPAPAARSGKPEAAAPAQAPTSGAPVVSTPRPAIWLLEDADTKIYLFGTVHIFERGFRWRSPRLDRIISEADELVTETGDDQGSGEPDFSDMFLAQPVPILDRVSPDRRKPLALLMQRSGLPREMWDQMHSSTAAIMLIAMQLDQARSQDQSGLAERISGAEIELYEAFRARQRPISGVESDAEQAAILRDMPPEAQRAFLDDAVDGASVPFAESGLAGDVDWATGNLTQIERDMTSMPRDLYDALLTRRNRNWTQWLQRRLERPGTVLFAVGVGHLVGPDSVQNMLSQRGLTVRRIE